MIQAQPSLLTYADMCDWLSDLLTNIAISVTTGAYTGLVVTRYINFQNQLESARVKVIKIPDLVKSIISKTDKHEARESCMSLFIEQASFAKSTGDYASAYRFTYLGQVVEEDLMIGVDELHHVAIAAEFSVERECHAGADFTLKIPAVEPAHAQRGGFIFDECFENRPRKLYRSRR